MCGSLCFHHYYINQNIFSVIIYFSVKTDTSLVHTCGVLVVIEVPLRIANLCEWRAVSCELKGGESFGPVIVWMACVEAKTHTCEFTQSIKLCCGFIWYRFRANDCVDSATVTGGPCKAFYNVILRCQVVHDINIRGQ